MLPKCNLIVHPFYPAIAGQMKGSSCRAVAAQCTVWRMFSKTVHCTATALQLLLSSPSRKTKQTRQYE